MSTAPRAQAPAPAPRARLQPPLGHAAAGEAGVCFAVEGAPPGASTSELKSDGTLCITTRVAGRVAAADGRRVLLEGLARGVEVRHLLPAEIRVDALVGHRVRVEVRHESRTDGTVTADARIRAPDGTLLLWARDGRVPAEAVDEASVRVSCEPGRRGRLAVVWRGRVATVGALDVCEVTAPEGRMLVLPLRVDPGGAAFVLLRA